MKYIDADKLKAHIEAKMKILWDRLPDADKEHPTDIELRDLGMYMALECLIDDLDSLQQEQQEELVADDLEEEVKTYFQGYWPGTDTAEQCNTDLHFTPLAIMRLARHFAEWQKQQMMKGAVEGYVGKDHIVTEGPFYCIRSVNLDLPNGFKEGDEVRIIIVKED